MLCQNCQRSDATTHLKRIVNGEAAEIHLCPECAKNLGVADVFPGIGGFGLLRDMLSAENMKRIGEKTLRCDVCGFSFDDISRTGMAGCPNCYRIFGEKLRGSLQKIHGRAVHKGKIPAAASEDTLREHRIGQLRIKLNEAIDEQNFERAAQLRDEIRALMA